MLTLKNRIKVWKLNHLVEKRNDAFVEGNYAKALKYGELVDVYLQTYFM